MSAPRKSTGGRAPDGSRRHVVRIRPFRDHAGAPALAVWHGSCRPSEDQLPLRHPYNFVVYLAPDELPSAADLVPSATEQAPGPDDSRPESRVRRLFDRLHATADTRPWGITAYFLPHDVAAEDTAIAAHYAREKAHRRDLPILAPDAPREAKEEHDAPWPIMENYGGGMQDYRDFALVVEGAGWEDEEGVCGETHEGVRTWFAEKGQGMPVEGDDEEEMPDPWVQRTRLDWAGQRMDEMFAMSKSWSEERQAEWDRMCDEVVPWR